MQSLLLQKLNKITMKISRTSAKISSVLSLLLLTLEEICKMKISSISPLTAQSFFCVYSYVNNKKIIFEFYFEAKMLLKNIWL